jgi:hypothetical protein
MRCLLVCVVAAVKALAVSGLQIQVLFAKYLIHGTSSFLFQYSVQYFKIYYLTHTVYRLWLV